MSAKHLLGTLFSNTCIVLQPKQETSFNSNADQYVKLSRVYSKYIIWVSSYNDCIILFCVSVVCPVFMFVLLLWNITESHNAAGSSSERT